MLFDILSIHSKAFLSNLFHRSLHSLNVWSLTVGFHIMSVHIIIDTLAEPSDVLHIATTIAQKGYNIKQSTIQIERYQEIDDDDAINPANSKSHSIVLENEKSIINILA